MYINRKPLIRYRRRQLGLGDTFNDETPCSSIPAGDPYRKPGNYCATPDGGYTTFNPDGTTYVEPGSDTSSSSSSSISSSSSGWGTAANVIGGMLSALTPRQQAPVVAASPGMSNTTKIALAGGAVLVAVLIARRR